MLETVYSQTNRGLPQLVIRFSSFPIDRDFCGMKFLLYALPLLSPSRDPNWGPLGRDSLYSIAGGHHEFLKRTLDGGSNSFGSYLIC
jgi:hypothetical protein